METNTRSARLPGARLGPPGFLFALLLTLAGLLVLGMTPTAGAAPRKPALPPTGATAGVAPGWTNRYPNLRALGVVTRTDAWAAGEWGRLLHWDGMAWTAVDLPATHNRTLLDISMVAATVGWIAADDHAFRYDGTIWTDQSAGLGTISETTGLTIQQIAAISRDEAWGVGISGTITTATHILLHWDGSRWNPAPLANTGASTFIEDLVFAGPDEGWAVGFYCGICRPGSTSQPLLFHYTSAHWAAVPVSIVEGGFTGVRLGGDGALWASGWTGGPGEIHAELFRYQDGAWTAWEVDSGLPYIAGPHEGWAAGGSTIYHWDGLDWTPEYTSTIPSQLTALDGAGDQVWAVGFLDGLLARQADGTWQAQQDSPPPVSLAGVVALGPDDAWMVGSHGALLHYTAGHTAVLTSPTDLDLRDVHLLSPTEGYAVGGDYATGAARGVILGWDGVRWSVAATTTEVLNSLALTGPGAGWAVGVHGAIFHHTGGAWVPMTPLEDTDLTAVAMDTPDHGWAVGTGPSLLEYTGGAWVRREDRLPAGAPPLADVALAPGGREGWAVGQVSQPGGSQAILHLQDGVWTLSGPAFKPAGHQLTAVAMDALGEAWAVGCGIAVHYVGGTWQSEVLPTWGCTAALALVPGRGGWAVGGGQILRYNALADGQRFYDVPLNNPFADFIEYMGAHGIINGYADNTFHPYANVTRGQAAKMVALGRGWPLVMPATPTFSDVPATHPFYAYVETAAAHQVISGYGDGTFHPQAEVTRGQIAKILVQAKGWGPLTPATPTFADVPASHPFYGYVEQAVAHGVVGGYGSEFRPANAATRAQLSKVLYLTITTP